MNNYQSQQFWNDINGVIGFATSIIVLGFMVGMVRSFWPEEKYHLVKRTKYGSLVTIHQEGDKAIIEVPNIQDMRDLSNLLNAAGIKWEERTGISKSAWEGTPVHLRSSLPSWHTITDPYPGKTIEFNFADLKSVMSQMRLSFLLLEEPKEHQSSSNITKTFTMSDEPQTPKQARYITILCMKLGIKEPLEEGVRTRGEAGRLIRELEAEAKALPKHHSSKLEGSEKFKQFVKDVVSDFNINKGWYQQEFQRLIPEVKISDIRLYGSYAPGGTPTEESDIDILVQYSGAMDEEEVVQRLAGRVFGYGGAFDVVAEKAEHHSSVTSPEFIQYGTCYEDAWRFLIKEEEGELIHGSMQLTKEGARVKHAWVELPTGYIWEPQTGQYFTHKNFGVLSPIEEHRYTVEQAAIMLSRVGKHGPWSEEERARWLGKQIIVKEIDMDGVFRFEATHKDFPYARGKVVLVSEPNYSIIVGLNVEKPIQRTGVGSILIMKALEKAKLIGKPIIIEKVTPAGNTLLKSMESRGLIKLTLVGEKVDVQADIGEMVDVGGGKSISASYRIEKLSNNG